MVGSKLDAKGNGNGIAAEDIWVSGMRQAGLSEQEIGRVITATATMVDHNNGHGELVPVKEAARRIGRSENTVRSWIRLGHLPTVERTPPPDHANGPWVHVDMSDVEALDGNHVLSETDRNKPISLKTASDRFGVPLGRLRGLVSRGALRVVGRERAPGGGRILVDPSEVLALIENPPRRGRPKCVQY